MKFEHKDFNDSALIELAARTLNTSSYQILKSAMIACNGNHYETHLDAAFDELMMGPGRIAKRYRKYIIEVLAGETIFYAESEQAILLA